jgi:hypothetical protein
VVVWSLVQLPQDEYPLFSWQFRYQLIDILKKFFNRCLVTTGIYLEFEIIFLCGRKHFPCIKNLLK